MPMFLSQLLFVSLVSPLFRAALLPFAIPQCLMSIFHRLNKLELVDNIADEKYVSPDRCSWPRRKLFGFVYTFFA